ncbi:hypothetical protein AKO1_009235 [Acrasis kona]|uniref:DDE Tnp4 domain-containing protein n=1 Tax=Acrasis kona TaxID=1008807 RepID=A0AAW2YRC6_9EUKA
MVARDTTGLTHVALKKKVQKIIKVDALKSITKFVRERHPLLWGTERSRTFQSDAILLALYHDITGTGYHALSDATRSWHNIEQKSLRHNTQILRHEFEKWGEEQITLGDKHAWNHSVRYSEFGDQIADANLRIDSTDMTRIGKRSTSKKSSGWSYKANSPAQRYMTLVDGRSRIVKLWGGYSPKIYDGDFLKLKKEFFEDTLGRGANILGDNHFMAGTKFRKCKFYCNIKNKTAKDTENKGKRLSMLTKDQKKFNGQHRTARAAVENPFGAMQTRFTMLKEPFQESESQQDALVTFACGHHNFLLRNRI